MLFFDEQHCDAEEVRQQKPTEEISDEKARGSGFVYRRGIAVLLCE
jgi:hypothetical protein